MTNHIYVIGDSFVMPPNPQHIPNHITEDFFWVDVISKNFPNHVVFTDGVPSRNYQSIIDNWIKILPKIKPEDFLVICLPFIGRTRLPLKSAQGMYDNSGEFYYLDRFIGTKSYNKTYHELEFWGNTFDMEYFVNLLSPQEIINNSDSSYNNFIEIISSLKKLTICKNYIFSWDSMKIKSEDIEDREDITNSIGYWESFDDLWKKTNGQDGLSGDLHWSFQYNKQIGEYILNKLINN